MKEGSIMSRFKKINVLVTLELISILFVAFISFAASMLPFLFINNVLLQILSFIVILIPLSLGLGFITKKIFDSLFAKIESNKSVSRINVKINDNIQIRNIETSKAKLYYINHYHLSTISFLLVNDLTLNNCKKIRSENNNFIKKKFKKAKKTNSLFSHWLYQVNIFVIESDSIHSNINELIIKLNSNQLYEIGKINVIYIKSSNQLMIKNFETKNISLVDFLRYKKMIKLLSLFTDLSYTKIIDNM